MKRWLIIAGGGLLALAVTFLAGRYSAPVKTITKVETKVETKVVTQVEYKDRIVYQDRVQVKTHKVIVHVKDPSGATTTTTTIDTGSDATHNQTTDNASTTNTTGTQTSAQTVTKIVEGAKPRLSLQVAAIWNPKAFDLKKPVLEGDVQTRLVGTFWFGARASYDLDKRGLRLGPVVRLDF
jgi:hypothetical protein